MDRGAWQAIVHGVARVGHDLATKPTPTNNQWRNRHGEQTYGHGERGGERVKCMERVTYITMSKIDSQWEFAVCLRELKQKLCINLEGWNGEGVGREVRERTYVHLWLIHVDIHKSNRKQ